MCFCRFFRLRILKRVEIGEIEKVHNLLLKFLRFFFMFFRIRNFVTVWTESVTLHVLKLWMFSTFLNTLSKIVRKTFHFSRLKIHRNFKTFKRRGIHKFIIRTFSFHNEEMICFLTTSLRSSPFIIIPEGKRVICFCCLLQNHNFNNSVLNETFFQEKVFCISSPFFWRENLLDFYFGNCVIFQSLQSHWLESYEIVSVVFSPFWGKMCFN